MVVKEDSLYQNDELAFKQACIIFELLRSIKRGFRCKFEKIAKQYGFTAPQLAVMFCLYEIPSITLNELSNHMMLTKSTVSGIIDRLAKQGVVIREIPKDNRRIVKLSISEEFKKSNDIENMKREVTYDLISSSIMNTNKENVEKIISGLEEFNSLLNNDNSK